MIRSLKLNGILSKIKTSFTLKFSSLSPSVNFQSSDLVISCRRKELDHYKSVIYNQSKEVPLASKGWNHSKSRGDHFTVLPIKGTFEGLTYSFRELGIHTNIIDKLYEDGIQKATEFQYRAIQAIQNGSHCLLAAETGCGKSLSYLLPIIQTLSQNKTREFNSPRAVIILPNRELAYQVGEVAQVCSNAVGLKTKVLVGGRVKKIMMNPTFDEVDILIATPGALGKLSTVGIYKLDEVIFTVLDEADTLLDDSFMERMNSIIRRLSQSQMILVSATIPQRLPDVLVPIDKQMKHIISPDIHKPLLNIKQEFHRLSMSMKPGQMLQLVKPNKTPMLIFSNRSQTCKWVSMFLRENGVESANINGDMNYEIRIEQWNKFVSGEVKILSATDVASRGLNTVQVNKVLNYDFPLYAADYIHRIGRVGRLGSPSNSRVINFVTGEQEVKLVQQIELAIRTNQPIVNVDGNITRLVQKKIAQRIRNTV